MLKKLVLATLPWFIAIGITVSAIVAMAYQQHRAREEYQAQSDAECTALAISPEEKHTCAKEAQNRKDYTHWWDVLLAWPEGITTWAIIATGFAIAWQSNETRKSAEAARKQLTHLATSERAWVLVKNISAEFVYFNDGAERFRAIKFSITLENWGKTPAFIEKIDRGAIFEKGPGRFIDSIDSIDLSGFLLSDEEQPSRTVLPPGSSNFDFSIQSQQVLNETESANFTRSGFPIPVTWGTIWYSDSYGGTKFSRFCYMYRQGGKIEIFGHKSRNHCE
jgi:hypothetical protein